MLLTCPSCSMRYLVANGSIGENGRKVKCASCGHQWFQEPSAEVEPDIIEPVPDIALEDGLRRKETPAPKPAADIPESVKPRAEESLPPVLSNEAKQMRDQDLIARVCGYFGAFLVFLCLFLLLAIFKGPVVKFFPPSVMFYELIRLDPPIPGKGLVIDQLHARVEGDKLMINGRVINLTTKDIDIPPVTLSILDAQGAVLSTHAVPMQEAVLKGETDIELKATLAAPTPEGVSLKAGFHLP